MEQLIRCHLLGLGRRQTGEVCFSLVVVWFRGELDHFDGGFADFVATVLSGDYAMEAELLAHGDPEGEPAPPQALWRPGCDWAGTDWQARWPLPPGSTDTPWMHPTE